MVEPTFGLGNEETKENILKHKYIKELHKSIIDLGYNLIEYRMFDLC